MKDHTCPRCGSQPLRWTDIAAAMDQMLSVAPPGLRPMMIQAAEEIREARWIIQQAEDAINDRCWDSIKYRARDFLRPSSTTSEKQP
jgi:hypothetical protein